MIQLIVEDEGTVTPMGNRLKELPDENWFAADYCLPWNLVAPSGKIQTDEMRGLKANAL
jgi:hypothetical protein